MVEAMFERSPNYFKQFQKQFKFLIVEEKPTFSIGFSVCTFCVQIVMQCVHILIPNFAI